MLTAGAMLIMSMSDYDENEVKRSYELNVSCSLPYRTTDTTRIDLES
jgi:hypothetical protein